MSIVWIILLDTSGSMGASFTSGGTSKLDTAKRALFAQLDEFKDETVVIIAFNDRPRTIFEGAARDLLSNPIKLNRFKAESPKGGTDIAAALDLAGKVLNKYSNSPINILVISDGESDIVSATNAAKKCARNTKVKISTILIEPNKDSIALAHMISIRGKVTRVDSLKDLGSAIAREKETLRKRESFSSLPSDKLESRPRLTIWAEIAQIAALLIAIVSLIAGFAGFLISSSSSSTTSNQIVILPKTLPGFLLVSGIIIFCASVVVLGLMKRDFVNSRPGLMSATTLLLVVSLVLMAISAVIYSTVPADDLPPLVRPTPTPTSTPSLTPTYTVTPTSSFTPTPISTSTPTQTVTPTFTQLPRMSLTPTKPILINSHVPP